MERQTTHVEDAAVHDRVKQISWPAIFAGALVAIGIQLLLALLGIGIGAGSIDPNEEQNPMAGVGTGALIWWIVSFLLALFAGGWVAGRLTGTRNKFNDSVHGVLTWVVFVLLNLWLLTSAAGSLIRSASGVLGSTVSMLGQGAAMNAPQLENEIDRRVDRSDVQNTVDSLQSRLPEYKAKARAVGDDVAKGVSKGGIFGFLGLLIGAIVASIGAVIGRRSYDTDVAVVRKRTTQY